MAYEFESKDRTKTSETFPSDYTILDLETTGLSSAMDCIIEFGAIRVRNHQPVASFSELCRPKVFHYLPFGSESEDYLLQGGRKICYVSEVITGITHISNRMLADKREEEDVLKDFFSFLGNDHVFGHNVSFDLGFLASRGKEFFQQSPCFTSSDTMKISRRLLPFLPRHRLMDLAIMISTIRKLTGQSRTVRSQGLSSTTWRSMQKISSVLWITSASIITLSRFPERSPFHIRETRNQIALMKDKVLSSLGLETRL